MDFLQGRDNLRDFLGSVSKKKSDTNENNGGLYLHVILLGMEQCFVNNDYVKRIMESRNGKRIRDLYDLIID
ncbi:8341_t:CDS:1, partial [Gigaspora rosea]